MHIISTQWIIIWVILQKGMDKINGYKNSIKTSQINNSRSVHLETNQGGHQQPMVLNQHVQHEDIKYTRDQLLEIKQKVRENLIFKMITLSYVIIQEDLELTKEEEGVGNT